MASPKPSPRPSLESRPMSHGRGGAGNMGTDTGDRISAEDLVTPTIKSDMYTTGRGGTGNMAKNENPQVARESQDVEEPPRPQSRGEMHVGRGGAANVVRESDEIKAAAKEEAKVEAKREEQQAKAVAAQTPATNGTQAPGDEDKKKNKHEFRGWADKGKDFLFGKFLKNKA
ncbi:hypothetical protein L228DRAFT_243365 [Xylona heveae TC161]|uniref:Uncharacterized protein n=1 Tax=Xylona heveae (strain CBS 132557 / TC161) TaxID=1328760 RepID=A0A165K036_XYLHT|nr:hypothetical protein L228DRAFT_243365 [Xylona heveae TC161]KZF26838.1 hypothetical protein L228DRAFT_243365 [Xylona heveae TC161]